MFSHNSADNINMYIRCYPVNYFHILPAGCSNKKYKYVLFSRFLLMQILQWSYVSEDTQCANGNLIDINNSIRSKCLYTQILNY